MFGKKMKEMKEKMKHQMEEEKKKMKDKMEERKDKVKKPKKKEDPTKGHTNQTDGINKKADIIEDAYNEFRIKLSIEVDQEEPDMEILKKEIDTTLSLADEFRKSLEEIELEEEKEFWTLYIDEQDELIKKKNEELDKFDEEVKARGPEWVLKHKADSLHADTHNRLANCISSLEDTDRMAAESVAMLHEQTNMMNEWHGEFMSLDGHLDKIKEVTTRMIGREVGNSHMAKILMVVVALLLVYFICLMVGVLDPYLLPATPAV